MERVLDLIKNKNYKELQIILDGKNSADISELFDELSEENVIIVYRLLKKEKAIEVFSYLEPDVQKSLINALTDNELSYVVNELFVDDTVDLIEEMPPIVVKRILKQIKTEQRSVINELLNYPEDSAGSIMTTEFIDFKENMTVQQCFDRIRKIGTKKETVYTGYILNSDRTLIGIVSLKTLLLARNTDVITDLMKTNFISVNTIDDKEEVAKTFDKYDLMALPVVDKENRLVGIVTVDDAIDVMHDEAEEDFEKMMAMSPNEESYFKTSVWKHAKNRFVWLLLLMVSSIASGAILSYYENAFAAIPLLVAFIPTIMGTGGNCGSQTATLIIRGLAMDEIRLKDVFKALWKEIRVAFIVGVVLMIVNSSRVLIQYHDLQLSVVLGLTLMITVMLSKTLGCLLPMLAKKLKMDPAIMAAPLITTIVDAGSIFVYFKIAILVMGLSM